MPLAAIALGSNLGDREANLLTAVEGIAGLGTVTALSSFWDTEPVGFQNQPRFLNGALVLSTGKKPVELLYALLAIEQSLGRDRASVPAKGPRVIDLDLLLYDDLLLDSTELTIPHPAMKDRAFVLGPLAEIAPGWIHPVAGVSVEHLLRECIA